LTVGRGQLAGNSPSGLARPILSAPGLSPAAPPLPSATILPLGQSGTDGGGTVPDDINRSVHDAQHAPSSSGRSPGGRTVRPRVPC